MDMKLFLHSVAGLFCLASAGSVAAQNYQSQYPYDPYSGTPQPQAQQQQPGGYEGYSAPSYGSGSTTSYDNKGGSSYGSGGGSSSFDSVTGSMLTWGHLSAHYAYNDFRGDDDLDGDSGFGADLHVGLMKIGFLHFGLDRITSSSPSPRDIEITTLTAGGGLFIPLGKRFQIFGEVGLRYDNTSGDFESINEDELMVYVRPGIRLALTDRWELSASVLFNNTDNLNDRVLEVSTYYALLDWLDVGGGVDFGSDINTFRIGGRWRWD
jgi:hypothetical protein